MSSFDNRLMDATTWAAVARSLPVGATPIPYTFPIQDGDEVEFLTVNQKGQELRRGVVVNKDIERNHLEVRIFTATGRHRKVFLPHRNNIRRVYRPNADGIREEVACLPWLTEAERVPHAQEEAEWKAEMAKHTRWPPLSVLRTLPAPTDLGAFGGYQAEDEVVYESRGAAHDGVVELCIRTPLAAGGFTDAELFIRRPDTGRKTTTVVSKVYRVWRNDILIAVRPDRVLEQQSNLRKLLRPSAAGW